MIPYDGWGVLKIVWKNNMIYHLDDDTGLLVRSYVSWKHFYIYATFPHDHT